jgi:hypothetical protein
MYVRTKVSKGSTYYQIVEGRREDGKVRQHVLCSMGQSSDPAAVLKLRRRRLAQYRRQLARWDEFLPAGHEGESAADRRRRAQLVRGIEKLTRDVAALTRFLEQNTTVGTTDAE